MRLAFNRVHARIKKVKMMNKYTPLIVGTVLYIVVMLIVRSVEWGGGIWMIMVAAQFLIIPIVIGYLSEGYLTAIIFTLVSVIIQVLVAWITRGLTSSPVDFTMLYYSPLFAVLSVVGAFINKRFTPQISKS
jgi:uncharacterized membrane protein